MQPQALFWIEAVGRGATEEAGRQDGRIVIDGAAKKHMSWASLSDGITAKNQPEAMIRRGVGK